MKGTVAMLGLTAAFLGGCSTMQEIQVRETKANPNWYVDCEQIGSEGFLFWTDEYAYACGMGESRFEQASETQAYAFAVKGFAERINGTVNISTTIDITNDSRNTRTVVEHSVQDTVIREHLEVKRHSYQSSTPEVADQPLGQYCYTEERIVKHNGSVSSKQETVCDDRPKVNHVTRSAGVSQECREYYHTITINGVPKNVKGFFCRFPNGRWEPVNGVYSY